MKNVIISCIGTLIVSFALSCGNTEKANPNDLINNPNSADGNVDMKNLPAFEFETEEHDFGRIIQGEQVSFMFKFKNAGKSDLVISGTSVTCGCTVADYPKNPIKPGEQGVITVSYNSDGKTGMQNKHITISANTQPNSKVLSIRAEVVVPEQ